MLLSIRPKFTEKIFSGAKTVELRRVRPSVDRGDLVLVYTSSPESALSGAFIVTGVKSGTLSKLWADVMDIAGVTQEEYYAYFQGADTAYAIGIGKAWTFEAPVRLSELRTRMVRFHPPQSYRYLVPADIGTLMRAPSKNMGAGKPSEV